MAGRGNKEGKDETTGTGEGIGEGMENDWKAQREQT